MLPSPTGLPALVARYAGDTQLPVPYIVSSWQEALAPWPDVAPVLTDNRWTRATTPARRELARADLVRIVAATDLADAAAVRRAFVLVMVWGSGTSNTRSYRYVPAALASDRCDGQLRAAAEACRHGDLAGAYAGFRLPGVRRSFFTKWFAFAGQAPGRSWQPLILDDRVLRTLNQTLGVSTRRMAGSRHWATRYQAYVEHLHAWAAGLDSCDAERLEWILFRHNGAPLPLGPAGLIARKL